MKRRKTRRDPALALNRVACKDMMGCSKAALIT